MLMAMWSKQLCYLCLWSYVCFNVCVGVYLLLLLVLLLLAVVSKVRLAVAMTHDQMRSEGGIIVDTCLMTTSSSLSSPSVLSLTPPSKPTLTSPLTISLLTPLPSQNNTKEFNQTEFSSLSSIGQYYPFILFIEQLSTNICDARPDDCSCKFRKSMSPKQV